VPSIDDVLLGVSGKLPENHECNNLLKPAGYLYGAPAQLMVRADSGVNSTMVGKKRRSISRTALSQSDPD
jgi:hypothetical protein